MKLMQRTLQDPHSPGSFLRPSADWRNSVFLIVLCLLTRAPRSALLLMREIIRRCQVDNARRVIHAEPGTCEC